MEEVYEFYMQLKLVISAIILMFVERECTFVFIGISMHVFMFNNINVSLCCIIFRMQMFIWNNIFFSLGFDVRDHYKDFGGDAAAYAAPVSANFTHYYLNTELSFQEVMFKTHCKQNRPI